METDIKYLTVKEAGEKWNISGRMVTYYCETGRINGAEKKGDLWLVPEEAVKPNDKRTRAERRTEEDAL